MQRGIGRVAAPLTPIALGFQQQQSGLRR